MELLLTFLLLFGVTTIVRWVIGPSAISEALPEIRRQLVVVGITVGTLVAGLILSPLGKWSGAHMNPAITFAMWRFGTFPGTAVAPYTVAQLAGSLLGVLAARGVWGNVTTAPPVAYAALQPAHGWSAGGLFLAETASTAAIVLLVGVFTSVRRLTRFTPCMVGASVCLAITLLGTSTGGSTNPARQFGPALAAGQFGFLWVYLLAPMLGAALASSVQNLVFGQHPGTHPGRRPGQCRSVQDTAKDPAPVPGDDIEMALKGNAP